MSKLKNKRERIVTIRLTDDEYEQITRYCHSFGLSKSKLIRKVLCQMMILNSSAYK